MSIALPSFNHPAPPVRPNDVIQLGYNYSPPAYLLEQRYLAGSMYDNIWLPSTPTTQGHIAGDQALRIYPSIMHPIAGDYTPERAEFEAVTAERHYKILEKVADGALDIPPRLYGIGPNPEDPRLTSLFIYTDRLVGKTVTIAESDYADRSTIIKTNVRYLLKVITDGEEHVMGDWKYISQYMRAANARHPDRPSALTLGDLDPSVQPVRDVNGRSTIEESVAILRLGMLGLPKGYIDNETHESLVQVQKYIDQ